MRLRSRLLTLPIPRPNYLNSLKLTSDVESIEWSRRTKTFFGYNTTLTIAAMQQGIRPLSETQEHQLSDTKWGQFMIPI